MKMISLLLLILSSCLCAATFVVNVTQSSYEAEENQNITLEWTFTSRTQGSYRDLFICCEVNTDHGVFVLYHVHEGVEIPESQDDQFSGRVLSDKDVLREGRIRLHVSRLRTEDSGLLVCYVKTEVGSGSATCQLNVSAKREETEAERKPETLTTESRRRTGLIVTAAALMMMMMMFFCCLVKSFLTQKQDSDLNNNREAEKSSDILSVETI